LQRTAATSRAQDAGAVSDGDADAGAGAGADISTEREAGTEPEAGAASESAPPAQPSEEASSQFAAFLQKIKNMVPSGQLFKKGQIQLVIGKQYKMSDIIRGDAAAEHPIQASKYSGPIRDILIATAACDMTYFVKHAGYEHTYEITAAKNIWGGSVGQELDEGSLESSWIRFNSDCADNFLYADGSGISDIVRISLVSAEAAADGAPTLDDEILQDEKRAAVDLSPCRNLDVGALKNDVRGLLIGSTISSGIGAASAAAGAITGGIGTSMAKKDDEKSQGTAAKLNLASTITSAVGAVGAAGGAVTSGIAISKLDAVIKGMEECKEAANKAR
jgi:hypothetical protein